MMPIRNSWTLSRSPYCEAEQHKKAGQEARQKEQERNEQLKAIGRERL
jgi:hypothetical protein